MQKIMFLFLLMFSVFAEGKDYKVFFKSEASDKRTNIVEPDVIFLDIDDKVIFNPANVDLTKVVVTKIDRHGNMSQVDTNTYRKLIDESNLKTTENCVYLYYSQQYLSSGAFGFSVVGDFYEKQFDALKTINHNQNFKDRMEHLLNNITPVDRIVSEPPPPSAE